jgi:hypothetical protein
MKKFLYIFVSFFITHTHCSQKPDLQNYLPPAQIKSFKEILDKNPNSKVMLTGRNRSGKIVSMMDISDHVRASTFESQTARDIFDYRATEMISHLSCDQRRLLQDTCIARTQKELNLSYDEAELAFTSYLHFAAQKDKYVDPLALIDSAIAENTKMIQDIDEIQRKIQRTLTKSDRLNQAWVRIHHDIK